MRSILHIREHWMGIYSLLYNNYSVAIVGVVQNYFRRGLYRSGHITTSLYCKLRVQYLTSESTQETINNAGDNE